MKSSFKRFFIITLICSICWTECRALLCYNSSSTSSSTEGNPIPATTCILVKPSDVVLPPATRSSGLRLIFHNPYSTNYLEYGRLLYSVDFKSSSPNGNTLGKSIAESLIRLSSLEIIICDDEVSPSPPTDVLGMNSVSDIFQPQPVRIKEVKFMLGERKVHHPMSTSTEALQTRVEEESLQDCSWSHSFQGTLLQDIMDLQNVTFLGTQGGIKNESIKSCLSIDGVLLDPPFDYQYQQKQQGISSTDGVGFSSFSIENITYVDWPMNNSRWLRRCTQKSFASFTKTRWAIHFTNVKEISSRTALGLLHLSKNCPQVEISLPPRLKVFCSCQFLKEWGRIQNKSKSTRIVELSDSLICVNLSKWIYSSNNESEPLHQLSLSQIYPPLTCHSQ